VGDRKEKLKKAERGSGSEKSELKKEENEVVKIRF
jgi:hypothetical protein